MCTVKGFENCISEIVAVGTREEMNKKLDDLDGGDGSLPTQTEGKENDKPTKKKRRRNPSKDKVTAEVSPLMKKAKISRNKENKTPSRKNTTKKPGSILLVTSGPSSPEPLSSLSLDVPPPVPESANGVRNPTPQPSPSFPPPLPPKPTNRVFNLTSVPAPDLEWYENSLLPLPAPENEKHPFSAAPSPSHSNQLSFSSSNSSHGKNFFF